MTDFEKNHGRDGLMILAAVRYCIGRRTYIVNDCVNWIIENWDSWPDHIKNIIQRDVEESFVRDDDARFLAALSKRDRNVEESFARDDEAKLGNGYKRLGDDCDRAEWERVRTLWS